MNYRVWLVVSIFLFLTLACGENENKDLPGDNIKETTIEDSGNKVAVEAMIVNNKLIEQKLPLTGVLIPNTSVDIIAEVSGKVKNINNRLGDYVRANQILAIIDDVVPESLYKQAEAQVISTENNLKIVESNLTSDKLLFESGDISELEFNNSLLTVKNAEAQYLSAVAALSAAKKTYDDTRIKSPISGFVSRKNINYGTMVALGNNVYRVVDLSKLKIEVSVPQDIINKVKTGGAALVSVSALNGKTFDGIVKRISPQADESTGGFKIEVQVENKENLIKAGMTAKLELILSKDEKVLAIPEYSLVTKNDENFVYKITDNTAKLVKIEILETMGENIIISSGVDKGDTIVVVGMKNLGLKTNVKIEELVK